MGDDGAFDDEFFDAEDESMLDGTLVGSNSSLPAAANRSLSESVSLFQSIHVLQSHESEANETDAGNEIVIKVDCYRVIGFLLINIDLP